jgi:hypothetical protein
MHTMRLIDLITTRVTTRSTTWATLALGTAALAAAATLTACGAGGSADASDATSGYCSELKEAKTFFQGFEGSDPDVSALGEAFDRMHALADIAPSTVADDWAAIDGVVDAIEDAMKDAGLTFEDLAAMTDGEVPGDVDLEKLTEVAAAFEELSGGGFDDAAQHISEHAKDTCGFDLPLS